MLDDTQTPFPTTLSRSQAFALKSTRPRNDASEPLSPVPEGLFSKNALKTTQARKSTPRSGVASRNLKENAVHTRSSLGKALEGPVNLKSKLKARRKTSFASLTDKRRDSANGDVRLLARKSSRSGSRVSLESPFSSRPSSPKEGRLAGPTPGTSPNGTKRIRTYGSDRASSKRRLGSLNLEAARETVHEHRSSLDPGRQGTEADLYRRASHRSLGIENNTGLADDLNFVSVDVDFNRPPSQMDIYDPLKDDYAYERGLAADPWEYDFDFEAGMLDASTPYNEARISRDHAAMNPVVERGGDLHTTVPPDGTAQSDDDTTECMSLTSIHEGSIHLAEELSGELSPWVSDSLISPPTIYRKLAAKSVDGADDDDCVKSRPSDCDATIQHLNAGKSDADAKPAAQISASSNGVDAATSPCKEPLAPAPVIAIKMHFGRTRTGTVTAAPPHLPNQTRARSGTITSNTLSHPSLAPAAQIGGRTRSGTVTKAPKYIAAESSKQNPPACDGAKAPLTQPDDTPVYLDSLFDPTPDEDMEFSSAPNPDIDVDAENGDYALESRSLPNASALANPITDINALDESAAPVDAGSQEVANTLSLPKVATGILAMTRRPRSALGKTTGAATSTTEAAAPAKQPKRLNVKAVLGLNGKSTNAQPKAAHQASVHESVVGNPPSASTSSGRGLTVLSSDPLDLLSHYTEDDFNAPFKGSIDRSRSKGRGKSRGRGKRGSKTSR